MIERDDIEKVASLARLTLSEAEVEIYGAQLGRILQHVETLQELDVADVTPMSHAAVDENVFRDDDIEPSLPVDDAIGNAPDCDGPYFRVPKTV